MISEEKHKKKDNKKENIILVAIFIILVTGVGAILYNSSSGETDAGQLAECLTGKSIKMYGSPTCPACNQQKELFGDASRNIEFVDCTIYRDECASQDIEYYPTWIIDGNKVVGLQSLDKLARISGCNSEV